MTQKEREVNYLVDESLAYERAQTRVQEFISDLRRAKNADKTAAEKGGVLPDKSYQIVIDAMFETLEALKARSDMLWDAAEKKADKYDAGFERLAQAVMESAAADYEAALGCPGEDAKSERKRIEKFAENGAERFTHLDFEEVLGRIRSEWPKFHSYVVENAAEIVADSRKSRRVEPHLRNARHRCPMCGGVLYVRGAPLGDLHTVRCTGCNFTAAVVVSHEKS